jgi:hypothetical protein
MNVKEPGLRPGAAAPRTDAGRALVAYMRQWSAPPERERMVLDIEDQSAVWVAWELGRLRAIEAAARAFSASYSQVQGWHPSHDSGCTFCDLSAALSSQPTPTEGGPQ